MHAPLVVGLLTCPAAAQELPAAPVELAVTWGTEQIRGPVVANANALANHGVVLFDGERALTGDIVPLAIGMRITTPSKQRVRFGDVIDGLMLFDLTGEGTLDARDPTFSALSVWVDADGDPAIALEELRPLSAVGITAITRFGDVRMGERPATP